MARGEKLRSSREVFDQIRWDPSLDPADYVIGYDTHADAPGEMPLTEFVPGGEIPWHRVLYIRTAAKTVWDRRTRVDRFVTAAGAPRSGVHRDRGTPDVRTLAPVYRSAVALVPPDRCWPAIQAIRSVHDRHFVRWMPHVNLLYGFVPDTHFADAAALLAPVVASVPPFTVTLARFEAFRHRQGSTVWLDPETTPPGALVALQRALEAVLPRCDEQGRKSPAGFTPHLSVGQLTTGDDEARTAAIGTWQRAWNPLEFTAEHIALISRREGEPFEVRYELALGTGVITERRH